MIADLGVIDYEDAYLVQREFVARRKLREVDDSVLLAEHNNVFTIGRTGKKENLLVSEDALKAGGVKVLRIDRGGDITFHGIGQLVAYPIIDLGSRGKDLHRYLRDLEQTVIMCLKYIRIPAYRMEGKTGVWSGGGKIAAIGVAATNWITYHGLSLNINTDLSFFDLIHPCGLKGVKTTSAGKILARHIDPEEVKHIILQCFNKIFGVRLYEPAAGAKTILA